jgi:hypothetical protein
MSLFVPNLKLKRGLLGGCLGGIIGAIGFKILESIYGELAGRLTIYLPQKKGYTPITAQIFKQENTIIIEYNQDYGQSKGMKKLRHELTDGSRRQLDPITLEIKIPSS